MDNLEEVLQALDEFQKMRPSEIPRELEDYLCWVAKTGDPVYQWSLIKTLFREKLTRVMTEFYESCPTLDLAPPCPNVEHFNYDTMKSNLLERLESFANAPFTVQRICELLTAPRKEYNRVDKFMRAIEKNILVVSTREPGPISRRNENGDNGMVNGSVDEDASVTQPPQDVEMEYWEKDCPSTVTISVHTVENETPLLHTVVPTSTVVKNVFTAEELSHEKAESTSSKSDIVVSSFIPTTSEFSGVSGLNSQSQAQDPQIGPTIQNLSTMVPETSGIIGDVSEAIMNEDTSSQPSLELENEGGDSADTSRKLQTTFQTKDFSLNESKSTKFYVDNSKVNEKSEDEAMTIHMQNGSSKSNDVLVKSDVELKAALDNKEPVNPVVESLLNNNENLENAIKLGTEVENIQSIIDTSGFSKEALESTSVGSTSAPNSPEQSTHNLILPADDVSTEETTSTSEDMSVDVENLKDQSKETELVDTKPLVEEPCSNATKNFNCNQEKSNLTITETVDENRVVNSIVPDPIAIVEEPRDTESVNIKEDISPIVEITEDSENNLSITCQSESKKKSTEDNNLAQLQGNNITSTVNKIEDSDAMIENVMTKKEQEAMELMEIDEEETLSVFQQDDEPMEQEAVQSSRS
ncbi:hypothetical protein K0M31_006193 [Melipona bicolor]|uniref:Serine/threonine-protein phosphatase 4 regulatory subunit 2 n=1 Tax=Melipona bicolor TaxID=60889 RepID=A0AA40FTL7_9HYME|nr:hypothetical protein K0M31_006193 [Melipona bicolor]